MALISLEEAKSYLRVDTEDEDAMIAILLSSADLDEVFRLSDRIVTLYEGEITGSFRAGEIAKEEIGLYMTGSKRQGGTEA